MVSDSAVLGNRVFAISFNGSNRWPLYGVFGPRLSVKESEPRPMGFTVNERGQLARTWGPEQVGLPHGLLPRSPIIQFIGHSMEKPGEPGV